MLTGSPCAVEQGNRASVTGNHAGLLRKRRVPVLVVIARTGPVEDAMKWTTDKPTVAGWYFFRQEKDCEGIFAVNSNLEVMVPTVPNARTGHSLMTNIKIHLLVGEWAGPIPEPEEPR